MRGQHNRNEIIHQGQHPLVHDLSEFGYSNPSMPGVSNVQSAIDYITAVLYPQSKAAVANVAALPLVANTLNDYRVVTDDGDGKAAGYRWEKREGDVAAKWYKIYDMDWGVDAVLEAFTYATQDLYVWKRGRTDIDSDGNAIVGLYAGQRISGGILAGENLTLDANSFDGTGFVQTENTFRPTQDGVLDLGTPSERFLDVWLTGKITINTLEISPGLITDTSGDISFDNENLTTTGIVNATTIEAVNGTIGGSLILAAAEIYDTGGSLGFNSNDLLDIATITVTSSVAVGTLTLEPGAIYDSGGVIDFDGNDFVTVGNIGASEITATRLDSDNVRIDGNTISILDANGSLLLSANGTGIVDIQSAMQTLGISTTGIVGITGQLNIDNLRLDGNVISSTNLNGNITLTPNGSGVVEFSSIIQPSADDTLSIGVAGKRISKLFLGQAISDGTTEIASSVLQSLRDINVGVAAGMTIFWDGAKWVASAPDTEVDHGAIAGLLDDDHTQYALLAGRVGGQDLIGGTAASNNLSLESTSHGTKGSVLTKDHFRPFTNASFSGSWAGTDLGGASNYFRDIYSKGELKGARLENYTFATLPASSAQNVGRLVYATDAKKIYVDNGTAFQVAGSGKYLNDEAFDGVVTSKDVNVSADITDARRAIWALHDNANDFNKIYCTIKTISASVVRIETHGALPAGSYRLIGIE